VSSQALFACDLVHALVEGLLRGMCFSWINVVVRYSNFAPIYWCYICCSRYLQCLPCLFVLIKYIFALIFFLTSLTVKLDKGETMARTVHLLHA
jgi:hypothetical protein